MKGLLMRTPVLVKEIAVLTIDTAVAPRCYFQKTHFTLDRISPIKLFLLITIGERAWTWWIVWFHCYDVDHFGPPNCAPLFLFFLGIHDVVHYLFFGISFKVQSLGDGGLQSFVKRGTITWVRIMLIHVSIEKVKVLTLERAVVPGPVPSTTHIAPKEHLRISTFWVCATK